MSTATRPAAAAQRPTWRVVAVPAEHGGWGLTVEPGLLGLAIAPSSAGLAIAVAAVVAFAVRTPLKVVAVDRRRRRSLPRTALAARIAAGEVVALAVLLGLSIRWAGPRCWLPALAAAPLFGIEAWFEVRSRGRHLLPELAGAIGVSSLAAVVALAGGTSTSVALGLWAVLAARAVASIPYVRREIGRIRGRASDGPRAFTTDIAAAALAAGAVGLDLALAAGAGTIVAIIALQRWWAQRPVVPAKVLGLRQLGIGVALVTVTAVGAVIAGT